MLFDMSVVEHESGWFATGTVQTVSVDGHIVVVNDNNEQKVYAISPLMHAVSWLLPSGWMPIGICADFTHGLLLQDDTVAVCDFNETIQITQTVCIGVPLLIVVRNGGLVVAGNKGWVSLSSTGEQNEGTEPYTANDVRVVNDAVVANNRVWQHVIIDNDVTTGLSDSVVLRVKIGGRAERLAYNTSVEELFTGKFQQRAIRTCAGTMELVNDGNDLYMNKGDNGFTVFAPTASRSLITPKCRVVTVNEYAGVGDMLTGNWTPASLLASYNCLAANDGQQCVQVVATDNDQLMLLEISLNVNRVYHVASWQLPNVVDAVVVNGRNVVAVADGNAYMCEASKPPKEIGIATTLVDIVNGQPVLAVNLLDINRRNAWQLNGNDKLLVYDLPRYGVALQDGAIVNDMFVTTDVIAPTKVTLPKECKVFDTNRIIMVDNQLMLTNGKELVLIDAKIEDGEYTLTSVNDVYYAVDGLVVAAMIRDNMLCVITEVDDQLHVIKHEVK